MQVLSAHVDVLEEAVNDISNILDQYIVLLQPYKFTVKDRDGNIIPDTGHINIIVESIKDSYIHEDYHLLAYTLRPLYAAMSKKCALDLTKITMQYVSVDNQEVTPPGLFEAVKVRRSDLDCFWNYRYEYSDTTKHGKDAVAKLLGAVRTYTHCKHLPLTGSYKTRLNYEISMFTKHARSGKYDKAFEEINNHVLDGLHDRSTAADRKVRELERRSNEFYKVSKDTEHNKLISWPDRMYADKTNVFNAKYGWPKDARSANVIPSNYRFGWTYFELIYGSESKKGSCIIKGDIITNRAAGIMNIVCSFTDLKDVAKDISLYKGKLYNAVRQWDKIREECINAKSK
jgi:hypothetical protein